MRTCEFCGEDIPNNAGFCGACGACGQVTNRARSADKTYVPRALRLVTLEDEQAAFLSEDVRMGQISLDSDRQASMGQTSQLSDGQAGMGQTSQLSDGQTDVDESDMEDEDEEKRRRLALIGFNLPLVGDGWMDQPTANVPLVQGTPQVDGAPMVAGAPTVVVDSNAPPMPGGETITLPPLVLPGRPTALRPAGAYRPRLTERPPGLHVPNRPQPQQAPGCVTWLIIVIIIPLLLLGGIIGVGLTILAPALAMEGSSSVTPGGLLHLHGSHFIPGGVVTCTLDGSDVLTYTNAYHPAQRASVFGGAVRPWALTERVEQVTQEQRQAAAGMAITVGGDGTFNATFSVEQNWSAGQHTIRATEALSPRSASITFSVGGSTQTRLYSRPVPTIASSSFRC